MRKCILLLVLIVGSSISNSSLFAQKRTDTMLKLLQNRAWEHGPLLGHGVSIVERYGDRLISTTITLDNGRVVEFVGPYYFSDVVDRVYVPEKEGRLSSGKYLIRNEGILCVYEIQKLSSDSLVILSTPDSASRARGIVPITTVFVRLKGKR